MLGLYARMSNNSSMMLGLYAIGAKFGICEAPDECDLKGADRCCICMCAPATYRLEPCGHRVVCNRDDCVTDLMNHGKCPLCRSVSTTMLDAKGEVVLNTVSSRTLVVAHVVQMAFIVFAAVLTGLAMRVAASGSEGKVDLVLACTVSVTSHLVFYFLFLLFEILRELLIRFGAEWPVKLFTWVLCVIDWLPAVTVSCNFLCEWAIVSLDDPPGTPPAKCTPARSRRQWNRVIYSVNSVAQAIIIWACLFHFKMEGQEQYKDPYGVAFFGALTTGLLRAPLHVVIFPAMFPLLFAVNV